MGSLNRERKSPGYDGGVMKDSGSKNNKKLETLIAGETNTEIIRQAIRSYIEGLYKFLSPNSLAKVTEHYDGVVPHLLELRNIIQERLLLAGELAVDVVASINERILEMNSPEFFKLIQREENLWRQGQQGNISFGIRACVDAGIPREATAGLDDPMGRSLAGDDNLYYNQFDRAFQLYPSTHSKRLNHMGRLGDTVLLTILIEHTGCGRRGQMSANLHRASEVSRLFEETLNNQGLVALGKEFMGSRNQVRDGLETISRAWKTGTMTKDGGTWAGVIVKVAQRQAYKHSVENVMPVVGIHLYDKHDGGLIAGLDTLEALTHPMVLEEGGFTEKVIAELSRTRIVFSLAHELKYRGNELTKKLTISKEKFTYNDLQNNWLEVNTALIQTVEDLWKLFDGGDTFVSHLVSEYLQKTKGHLQNETQWIQENESTTGASLELVRRRLIHQLFRAIAYTWVLNTLEKGNAPGHHMEDHAAIGDSSIMGAKRHLPLGQGDMQPPSAGEIITQYTVLKGDLGSKPLLLTIKMDTEKPDDEPMSTEETERALRDLEEVLQLWPYVLVGEIVPIVLVRNKKEGYIGRAALSPLQAYNDIVSLMAHGKMLPDFVPASSSKGRLVLVPAEDILECGVRAGKDLLLFRKLVAELADNMSNSKIQSAIQNNKK